MKTYFNADKLHEPINVLYAVLAIDDKGNEGIVSATINNIPHPLVFNTEKTLQNIREAAKEMNHHTGQKMRIVKFTNKEIVETFE